MESPKLRLMCSYGGHIIPRPNTKSLSYTGGDTRIVSIDRRTSFASLISHLSRTLLNNRPFYLKYQIPNEDLDSLISVTTDEDLDNMIDEHDRVTPPSRIRLFLFPVSKETTSFGWLDPKSDSWFCDALKGTRIVSNQNNHQNSNNNKVVAESFVLETSSSFGSTGSTFSMSNSAPVVSGESCGLGLFERKVRVPSSASIVSSDNNSPGDGLSPPKAGQLKDQPLSSPTKAGQLQEQPLTSPPKAGELQEQPLSSPTKAGQVQEQTLSSLPKAGQLQEQTLSSLPKAGQLQEQTLSSPPKAGQLQEQTLSSPPKAGQLQEQAISSPPKAGLLQEQPLIQVSPEVPLTRTKSETSPETTVGVQIQTQSSIPIIYGYPSLAQQPDGKQLQQQEPQFIQGGMHYQPQYAVNQMPVTSYYPVYQMPMQRQQPVHYQPNQPYPIYFVPVRPNQYHNMPIQCAVTDGSNYGSPCGLQLHTPAAINTSNGALNEMFAAEATTNVYRNISSKPVTPDFAASASQCNEFDEDIVYNQIFKSQPPAPVLPSQYQPITNGVPVMLSESSVQLQQSHVKELEALHPI